MKSFKYIIILPVILLIFQLSACEQQDIWGKTDDPIDDTSPELSSALPLSNTEIQVQFSEEMDKESSEDVANYSIPGLTITGAVRSDTDKSLVTLTTSSQQTVNYNLTVTGASDEFLNEIDNTLNTATFTGDGLPYVSNVYAISNTTVRVRFSEPVTGADTAIYEISSGLINVNSISILSTTLVELTTDLQDDITYTLTVNSVTDIDNLPESNDPLISYSFTGDALPEVYSVVSTSNTSVQVTFTEPVNNADVAGNYTISPLTITGVTTVTSTVYDLTTTSQNGITYSLYVSNVEDRDNYPDLIDPGVNYDFTGTP